MLLGTTSTSKLFPKEKEWDSTRKLPVNGNRQLDGRLKDVVVTPDTREVSTSNLSLKKMLQKVEMGASAYDTAWVAMVPSEHTKLPRFERSLKWIMQNQEPDGSWSFADSTQHPLLIKDSLSSTLASVLALQTWNVGQHLVHKGLDYIGSNIWAAIDKDQYSPIGFDVIFPSMIEYAHNLGLNLSLNPSLLNSMLRKRELETTSLKEKGSNLAYIAEGLMNESNINWNDIMKYQRRNGSILNSPASTAAALIHLQDAKCLQYLHSLMVKFDNAVPTAYPFDIYARLSAIDELEKLGIDRHVKKEILSALDDIYRYWLLGSQEIFADPTCCAMAFRLLRMNGYIVSSELLANYEEEESLSKPKDAKCVMELFKASQLTILQNEPILDKIYSWTSSHLKQELALGFIPDKNLQNEVDYVVKHPHANLKRLENRKYIEHYNTESVSLLKTSYRFLNIDKRGLLTDSAKDFNKCQSIFQKELAYLARWEKKYQLGKLKYARQRLELGYFSIASDLFEPEFGDARLAWTQNTVLTTVVDDFFDHGGSMEELLNLIDLIQRWDQNASNEFMSEEVEILYFAIYDLINEHAEKARKYQGRCIKSHLIEIWIDLLKAMLKESEYIRYKKVPTVEEYTESGSISIGFGPIVLVPLYFMDKLSEEVVISEEYQNLYKHAGVLGRLMNDHVTAQKDIAQGKLNSVSLRVLYSNGTLTEKEAEIEVGRIIEKHRRELLRMVLQKEGSIVPKACKDLFWTTSKELNLFFMNEDHFSSPMKLMKSVNEVLNHPLHIPNNFLP